MEFLIDTQFWNLVIKELPPSTALSLKKHLKADIINGTKAALKKECLICIDAGKKFIMYSHVIRQCQNTMEILTTTRTENNEIEKAILKTLIETQGLSEKIKYQPYPKMKLEFVVQQQKPITIEEKGFVYLIRNEDIYKIGITDNLLRRFNQLKPDEVLNVVRCSNFESLEKELHKKFKEYRIPQTEYFRLSKNQIEQVNIEMTKGADF